VRDGSREHSTRDWLQVLRRPTINGVDTGMQSHTKADLLRAPVAARGPTTGHHGVDNTFMSQTHGRRDIACAPPPVPT